MVVDTWSPVKRLAVLGVVVWGCFSHGYPFIMGNFNTLMLI